MNTVNQVTGEVTVELEGKIFRLKATMERLAEFHAQLNKATKDQVPGFAMMYSMIAQQDPRAVILGLKHLCVSGNEAQIKDLSFGKCVLPAVTALIAAITEGMPKDEGDTEGNSEGTGTET